MQDFPHRRFSFAQLLGLPAYIWQICSPHTLVLFNKINKLFGDTSDLQNKLHITMTRTEDLLQKQADLSENISNLEQRLRSLVDSQRRELASSLPSDTHKVTHVLSFPVNRPIIDTTRQYRGVINLKSNDEVLSRYSPRYVNFQCNAPHETADIYKQYLMQVIVYPNFEKPSSEDAVLVDLHNDEMCVVLADGVSQSALGGIAAKFVCKYIHFEWIMALQYNEFTPNPDWLRTKTSQLIREALYQAMYHVNSTVTQAIQKNSSTNTQTLLNERLHSAGSQSTFACVFTYSDYLVCVWMGNTRIILMHSSSHAIIAADDVRFDSDQARFSSHPSTLNDSGGLFGDLQIQIIPLHTIGSLHIMIMSDGFEINKLGVVDSLFTQKLDKLTFHAKHASQFDDSSLVYMKLTKSTKDSTLKTSHY